MGPHMMLSSLRDPASHLQEVGGREVRMLSVVLILVLVAFGCTIASATVGRVPLWVAVLLLCLVQMLQILPR